MPLWLPQGVGLSVYLIKRKIWQALKITWGWALVHNMCMWVITTWCHKFNPYIQVHMVNHSLVPKFNPYLRASGVGLSVCLIKMRVWQALNITQERKHWQALNITRGWVWICNMCLWVIITQFHMACYDMFNPCLQVHVGNHLSIAKFDS